MGTLLGTLLLLVTVRSVAALSCLPCDRSKCPPPPSCPADVITDVCGCCAACAKVEGERCGGPWWTSGKCSSGLVCNKDPKDFNADGVCVGKGGQQCPPRSSWSQCGSACEPKCGDEPKFCTLQCVARCVCDDRTHVWHNDMCIPRDSCPRQSCEYNGKRYEVGESWEVRETAGKNCLCDGRGERCLFVDCSRGSEHYLAEEGTWDCRPVPTLCPPGVDVVNCFADPCQVTRCPAHPDVTCRSNYCGGCNAVFFDSYGNKVNCKEYGTCPRGYTKPSSTRGRSLCYRFERKPSSYREAQASCRVDGGRLVTIRSFITQFRVTILTFLKLHADAWIGLSARGRTGRLVWSDGVKYDRRRQYSHWCPRTRNNPGNNCVYMSRPLYRWQRGKCGAKRAYVCEYNPYKN
ncbi:CRIM1 [Branchiostoma lanceolatum]|uniref:CRIM1 protein n=1 Tax=Branchiostoma lanceolatum TaxID=7740 RepID=A0A8K0EQG9_BRALA|nr:CRIM1 [Branchiostoma lanceolatum]